MSAAASSWVSGMTRGSLVRSEMHLANQAREFQGVSEGPHSRRTHITRRMRPGSRLLLFVEVLRHIVYGHDANYLLAVFADEHEVVVEQVIKCLVEWRVR